MGKNELFLIMFDYRPGVGNRCPQRKSNWTVKNIFFNAGLPHLPNRYLKYFYDAFGCILATHTYVKLRSPKLHF